MSNTNSTPGRASPAVANEHSDEVTANTVVDQPEQNDEAEIVESDDSNTVLDSESRGFARQSRYHELREVFRTSLPSDPVGYYLADEVDRIVGHADSLNWVLEKLATLLKPVPPAPVLNSRAYVPAPFNAEIKYWTLAEWRDSRRSVIERSVIPPGSSAIDVLLEELDIDGSRQRRFRKDPSVSASAEVLADTTKRNLEDRPALPPRIRVNSISIRRLFNSVCDDNEHERSEDRPLILDRPFKKLVLFNHSIREKVHELRKIISTRETYLDEHPDTRTPSELQDRTFHDGGAFSTRTYWEILTLHELKQASDEFACLVQFMDKFLKPITPDNYPTDLPFVDLWHLFMSDDHIYVKNRPQKVWRLLQATGGRRYLSTDPGEGEDSRIAAGSYSEFDIDAYHLDYDGTAITPVFAKFSIERSDDYVQLRSLPFLPLQIAQKEGLIDIDATRARGEIFLEYCTHQHRHYNGMTLSRKASGSGLLRSIPGNTIPHRVFSERIDSQVVVDFERAIQANPDWNTSGTEPKVTRASVHETVQYSEVIEPDVRWDKSFSDELLEEQSKLWRGWEKGKGKPDGDNLLLLPDQVYGYILRNRTWACFQIGTTGPTIGRLQRIQARDDSPWEDLEIPMDHKHIVQSLISNHFSADHAGEGQFDLVKDKGKGVVVLLHGVPGVGKTATAECVAESEKRPLLPITCGDLGLQPKEVEATLQTAFQLAQAWGCVLLLDEADIFLAQRDNHDIERNALVSVFLRILEYYEGILFLTTNRVGAFDEAFKSRIHMALYYPPLNLEQTRKIWAAHIRRGRKRKVKVDCNELELLGFAETLHRKQLDKHLNIGPVWNGRQIRNAFQSAVALARNQNAPALQNTIVIQIPHFQQVADVSNHFNKYIFATKKGRSDADLARQQFMRDDGHAGISPRPDNQSQYQTGAYPVTSVARQATPLNPNGFPAPAFGPAYPAAQTGFVQQQINPLFQPPAPNHPGYQPYAQGAVHPQTQQQMYHQVQQPQQMNYQQQPVIIPQQMYAQPGGYPMAAQVQPDQSLKYQAGAGAQSQQQQQQGQSGNLAYGGGGGVQTSSPQGSTAPS